MAHLPATTNNGPKKSMVTMSPEAKLVLVDRLARGDRVEDIVRELAPGKGKIVRQRRRRLRAKLYMLVATDEEVEGALFARSRAILRARLPEITEALAERAAQTGKPDAVKLVLEVTGMHNPRVDHKHDGEIKLSLEMPRPERIPPPEDDVIEGQAT